MARFRESRLAHQEPSQTIQLSGSNVPKPIFLVHARYDEYRFLLQSTIRNHKSGLQAESYFVAFRTIVSLVVQLPIRYLDLPLLAQLAMRRGSCKSLSHLHGLLEHID